MKFNKTNKRGFTLVEVIIVLVILAILAAMLIPSLTGYIDKAQTSAAIAECRMATAAAQTLASEEYGGGAAYTYADIKALAEVGGNITAVELSGKNVVVHLTYVGKYTVVYCNDCDSCTEHTQMYTVGGAAGWSDGTQYSVGDAIVINGIHFVCVRAHTSGNAAPTRNPTVGSGNKSSWRVTSFDAGADNSYHYIFVYSEGVEVIYNGQTYKRTAYNPSSSPVPAGNPQYWELVA